jgi:hypothetical protein
MYLAKSGKGCLGIHRANLISQTESLEIESKMHKLGRGEFLLYYQPQNVITEATQACAGLVGVEASCDGVGADMLITAGDFSSRGGRDRFHRPLGTGY